jgi:hypothetical protein
MAEKYVKIPYIFPEKYVDLIINVMKANTSIGHKAVSEEPISEGKRRVIVKIPETEVEHVKKIIKRDLTCLDNYLDIKHALNDLRAKDYKYFIFVEGNTRGYSDLISVILYNKKIPVNASVLKYAGEEKVKYATNGVYYGEKFELDQYKLAGRIFHEDHISVDGFFLRDLKKHMEAGDFVDDLGHVNSIVFTMWYPSKNRQSEQPCEIMGKLIKGSKNVYEGFFIKNMMSHEKAEKFWEEKSREQSAKYDEEEKQELKENKQ